MAQDSEDSPVQDPEIVPNNMLKYRSESPISEDSFITAPEISELEWLMQNSVIRNSPSSLACDSSHSEIFFDCTSLPNYKYLSYDQEFDAFDISIDAHTAPVWETIAIRQTPSQHSKSHFPDSTPANSITLSETSIEPKISGVVLLSSEIGKPTTASEVCYGVSSQTTEVPNNILYLKQHSTDRSSQGTGRKSLKENLGRADGRIISKFPERLKDPKSSNSNHYKDVVLRPRTTADKKQSRIVLSNIQETPKSEKKLFDTSSPAVGIITKKTRAKSKAILESDDEDIDTVCKPFANINLLQKDKWLLDFSPPRNNQTLSKRLSTPSTPKGFFKFI